MKKYELLSHTADVIIHAEADSPEELFLASLDGLCDVLVQERPRTESRPDVFEEFQIKTIDMSALIVDFLSDCLAFMHTNNGLAILDSIQIPDDRSCKFTLELLPVNSFDDDVKAVTYHGARIETNSQGNLEVNIILDI